MHGKLYFRKFIQNTRLVQNVLMMSVKNRSKMASIIHEWLMIIIIKNISYLLIHDRDIRLFCL